MQPNRSGGSFSMSPFWGSVWGVAAFLFAVGLLQYIFVEIATLFGFMPQSASLWLVELAGFAAPVAGTLLYIDWRWGWKADNIGLTATPAGLGWAGAGLVTGVMAAFLTVLLTGVLGGEGTGALIPAIAPVTSGYAVSVGLLALRSFAVELVFRGAVVSRYQADLTQREVLVAATLTPFAWNFVQMLFGLPMPWTGIDGAWMGAMSVALALLFLRTDSVWFSAGIRLGIMATLALFGLQTRLFERGGLVVWGITAAVLLALEWQRQQRTPRRVQSGPRVFRGRTTRGPWGPH